MTIDKNNCHLAHKVFSILVIYHIDYCCFSDTFPSRLFLPSSLPVPNPDLQATFRNHAIRTKTPVKVSTTTAITSNKKYWYQDSSKAADRKWSQFPCLSTYSIQNIAFSRGGTNWSFRILDLCWATFLYLKQEENVLVVVPTCSCKLHTDYT